jgi:Zn-dependent protease
MAPAKPSAPSTGGFTLFHIAGIRVALDFSWFIVFFLVLLALSQGYFPRNYPGHDSGTYWLAGFVATLLFFASVVAHEFSHSLMALRAGINIPEITLFIFGGVSRLAQEPSDPKTEFKIAVVGPLCSFVLAAIFWALKVTVGGFVPDLFAAVLRYLAFINIALGIFNLVPGFPLDGGRILRAVIWWRTGSLTRATKVATDLGKGFAVALMVLGALQIFAGALINGLWFLFIGMFLRGMSQRGYEEVIIRKSLEGVSVREVMVREVVTVPPGLHLDALVHDYFLHYAFQGFPVVDQGRVLGLVFPTAVREVPREAHRDTLVESVMAPLVEAMVIAPDASLANALVQMAQEELDRLLVMEGQRLAGLITKSGLLRLIQIKQVLEA